jgi:dTDP-4-dehydrorhamnose 3,5-epimerase
LRGFRRNQVLRRSQPRNRLMRNGRARLKSMPTVRLIETRRFADDRGWFSETYRQDQLAGLGIADIFVQDNHSLSRMAGTLRGIHFQVPPRAQAKLVRCLRGRILDVAVDLRRGSPTFARSVSVELSGENGRQLYIPVGFGHALLTLEPDTEVAYKVSDFYAPGHDKGIRWDDPDIAIGWPFEQAALVLSQKDAALPALSDFDSPFAYDGQPLQPLAVD